VNEITAPMRKRHQRDLRDVAGADCVLVHADQHEQRRCEAGERLRQAGERGLGEEAERVPAAV